MEIGSHEMKTIRYLLATLLVSAAACDIEKDVGDAPDDDGNSTTTAGVASTTGTATSDGSQSGSGQSPGTTPTTGTNACPGFDAGPVGDPNEFYEYQCFCDSCQLSYSDIPFETVQQFDSSNLCECLCQEAGCGGVEGEGGVASGAVTDGSSGGPPPDTDGGETTSATSGGSTSGG